MRLMISVISAAEAREALAGGVEILDIKNPAEGSLGAQSPQVIREIKKLSAGRVEVSVAIGDMPNLPGTAALAAVGAAVSGADYIKVGLHGPRNESEALALLGIIQQSVREYPVSVIAAGYADFRRAGALDPGCLPRVAASSGIRGCLLDTAVKDGQTLFNFLNPQQLRDLAEQAHKSGLLFGLAGSLCEEDLPLAHDIGADVVGLRTAACRNNQRSGPLDPDRIRALLAHNSLKDRQWSQGKENIQDSIKFILLTEPGERLMLPEFGAGLSRFMFEPNTVATRRSISEQIASALLRWEPRIQVENVEVEQHPELLNTVVATIAYRLVSTHALERVSLEVNLTGS
jgi:uncharacterized protein (UPF0264 family)/phage baseplate assembly protein W